ncbi:transposase family protein [Streptomyces virginiae]|uniref:transposase family protein n=1 Tax=Streptomyces virginiae TaxID=1961 RepID=UPI00224D91B5|nr:transposase family protein [Streptomyces virginiae]MCX4960523.1 transposase family protein [Streptomyces virginiae]
MAGVITVSEPFLILPFTGLSPRQFAKPVTAPRRAGVDTTRRGRPWSLPLEDRMLLVTAYWRTYLTIRQLAPLFGISKSAADRIIDHHGLLLAPQPRRRFARDTRRDVAVGRPLPGNRNDFKAWEQSGAEAAVGRTMTIADGGYPGTGLVMPHRRRRGEELPDRKQERNRSHKQIRARVEHAFARMKTWKILRDCRLKGDGVHHAMLGIAHLHNLNLAG